jgi:hypothetical protein
VITPTDASHHEIKKRRWVDESGAAAGRTSETTRSGLARCSFRRAVVLVGLTEQPCWGGDRGAILKNTRRSALAERFPHLVKSVDISDTRDQMQVSDRTKIVDLGSGTFDLFFAVMAKIDFVTEARRQLVEQLFCSWPIGNRRPRALMLT